MIFNAKTSVFAIPGIQPSGNYLKLQNDIEIDTFLIYTPLNDTKIKWRLNSYNISH